MNTDLRKNPRFITTNGTPAKIHAAGKILDGTILNFSSTGFAIIVGKDIGAANPSRIEVTFSNPGPQSELRLSASIINTQSLDESKVRLGCRITDMNNQSDEYFDFLTSILGKQGFLKSLATKPKFSK
ncbi:MAG: PilZ domain [Proteobacteria bacterium]|nr:PilZ domain [Pseudomonadota bacterium]